MRYTSPGSSTRAAMAIVTMSGLKPSTCTGRTAFDFKPCVWRNDGEGDTRRKSNFNRYCDMVRSWWIIFNGQARQHSPCGRLEMGKLIRFCENDSTLAYTFVGKTMMYPQIRPNGDIEMWLDIASVLSAMEYTTLERYLYELCDWSTWYRFWKVYSDVSAALTPALTQSTVLAPCAQVMS
ncbi:hypothetical protein PMIN06_006184 [Paraphaeosphaeria minitans]